MPGGLTSAQITTAQQLAAGAAGMSVETRNSIPSLAQIIDAATIFGIVLALGILGMSVGLVRSEAARDLRTLTATGASGSTRRTITAATAGALAFTGAVVGIVGGYLAAIGFFRQQFARRPVLADQHPGRQPAADPRGHAARRGRPRLAAGRPRPGRHRPPAAPSRGSLAPQGNGERHITPGLIGSTSSTLPARHVDAVSRARLDVALAAMAATSWA